MRILAFRLTVGGGRVSCRNLFTSEWSVNLAALGEDNIGTFGEYPALVFEGREITNVDQQCAANRLANALRRLGVGPGRVAILLPNCPEVLQAYAAILKVGAVIVPIVFLLGPAEVRHILAHSEARVVITAPELRDKVESWPGTVIVVGEPASDAIAWHELVPREPDRFDRVERAPDDIAVILYTAGTTGQPKGVALSHFLYIVERKKDLIIRGGFNIYPREVEEVLYAHPDIAEAAVVGRRDPLMGEEVLAFVVAKRGRAATAEDVMAFCRERLAKFKCPKEVRFVDVLPKSPIGKILRKELRARAG